MERKSSFIDGVKAGIPIGLGYIAVSFTFGIMARKMGFTLGISTLISATNLTSAGQFAGIMIMANSGGIIELIMSQIIINSRYFLMSFALSQKIDPGTSLLKRLIISFGVTDEIFATSIVRQGRLSPYFIFGNMAVAVPSWSIGTFLGALSGSILPEKLVSSMSIALYAMLICAIMPTAKKDRVIRNLIVITMIISGIMMAIPLLNTIETGKKVVILTLVITTVIAIINPIEKNDGESI